MTMNFRGNETHMNRLQPEKETFEKMKADNYLR